MAESASVEQLIDDFRALVRDAEALLSASAGYVSDGVQEARARAAETLSSAKQRLDSLQEDVVGGARDALESGEHYLRDNPWQSLAIAAGIGFLAGALFSRRRS